MYLVVCTRTIFDERAEYFQGYLRTLPPGAVPICGQQAEDQLTPGRT